MTQFLMLTEEEIFRIEIIQKWFLQQATIEGTLVNVIKLTLLALTWLQQKPLKLFKVILRSLNGVIYDTCLVFWGRKNHLVVRVLILIHVPLAPQTWSTTKWKTHTWIEPIAYLSLLNDSISGFISFIHFQFQNDWIILQFAEKIILPTFLGAAPYTLKWLVIRRFSPAQFFYLSGFYVFFIKLFLLLLYFRPYFSKNNFLLC